MSLFITFFILWSLIGLLEIYNFHRSQNDWVAQRLQDSATLDHHIAQKSVYIGQAVSFIIDVPICLAAVSLFSYFWLNIAVGVFIFCKLITLFEVLHVNVEEIAKGTLNKKTWYMIHGYVYTNSRVAIIAICILCLLRQ